MKATLARHGIIADVQLRGGARGSVTKEILSRVADVNADLLVLGAYGHSRFRELVFGGVSRHMLHEMTVPTLFSH